MSQASPVETPNPEKRETPAAEPVKKTTKAPDRIFLVPFPKIIFLYPTMLTSLIAAICLSIWPAWPQGAEEPHWVAIVAGVVFLGVLAVNLVVLAFDFPRATSLTLFFLIVAVVLGIVLLGVMQPEILPRVAEFLSRFHPMANATFYWTFGILLAVISAASWVHARFDCWEARPNELLHHHGLWGNLERFPAPGTRIDKEINDVFEFLLLGSGRLILHPPSERMAIVLDNIPFIRKKEAALTQMLGALQVKVRNDDQPVDA